MTKGLSLKFFDAYRPYSVTKEMWKVVPDEKYAANPAKGNGHNRGAAVDVTLMNVERQKELAMPTKFDISQNTRIIITIIFHRKYWQTDSFSNPLWRSTALLPSKPNGGIILCPMHLHDLNCLT